MGDAGAIARAVTASISERPFQMKLNDKARLDRQHEFNRPPPSSRALAHHAISTRDGAAFDSRYRDIDYRFYSGRSM